MGTVPFDVDGHSRLSAGRRYAVHVIVSSVGPYRFSIVLWGAALDHAAACSSVSASPAKRLHSSFGIDPGCSRRRRLATVMTDGTENQCVMPRASTNWSGARISS